MRGINWKQIIILGLVVISTGCLTTPTKPTPTKPTIKHEKIDNLICFDRENYIKLGAYILELEN